MKFFPSVSQTLLSRALLPIMLGAMALSLASCGATADDPASSKKGGPQNGVTLKGDGLNLDATMSAALLGGYAQQPLSVRIMSGWVDKERIARANQITDKDEKMKESMGSFGTLTVQVSAGTAAPGTYQLAATEGDAQSGTVIIDKEKNAGLDAEYTSESGTLTIKSVTVDGRSVDALEGSFDGQFASEDGDSRALSGTFLYVPTKK